MKKAFLLHGWPVLGEGDLMLIDHLKNVGYEVVVPDMFSDDLSFNPAGIKEFVERELKGKKPALGIGVSLGGLILPYLAKDNPQMKMIFIASGTNLKTNSKYFNFALTLLKNKFLLKLILKLYRKLPYFAASYVYKLGNPLRGKNDELEDYNKDMAINIEKMRKISNAKQTEVLNYVSGENTAHILQDLDNETLIFAGKNDNLMTLKGAMELHSLLKNSKMVITNGEHFNVFNRENLKQIDKFLLY